MTWEENNRKGNQDIRSCKMIHGNNPQKSVQQLTKQGECIAEYTSISNASRATGVATTSISQVCKNKQKVAGGYKWRYSE